MTQEVKGPEVVVWIHYLNKSKSKRLWIWANVGIALLQLIFPKRNQNTGNHIYQIQNFWGEDLEIPHPPFAATFVEIRCVCGGAFQIDLGWHCLSVYIIITAARTSLMTRPGAEPELLMLKQTHSEKPGAQWHASILGCTTAGESSQTGFLNMTMSSLYWNGLHNHQISIQ